MHGNPKRNTIRVAGLLLYPLPGNCVLEYDDSDGRRCVMLLNDDLDQIAALQRAWINWTTTDVMALQWMDTHRPRSGHMKPLKTNPEARDYDRRSTYYLGWNFDTKRSSVREYKTA